MAAPRSFSPRTSCRKSKSWLIGSGSCGGAGSPPWPASTNSGAQARQRIDFHVAGPADASVFAGLPEIVSLASSDSVVHLVVEGSVDGVLKAAAGLEVRRVVTHDADLEEVFLGYYRDDLP